MSTMLSDRCPKCGRTITYTPEATALLCPCGHSFLVVEFVSERQKMEQAQADRIKAREALSVAEAEKEALQTRLNGTFNALQAIEGSQLAEDAKLGEILDTLKTDHEVHEAMTVLLRSIQQEQQSGKDVLSKLVCAVMKEQTRAADKLSAVETLSSRILNAQKSGADAQERMQDEILERIEKLDLNAREKLRLSNEFYAWSRSIHEEDVRRLQNLQASSDTLLQGQKKMTAQLDVLSNTIVHTKAAVDKGFDELRKQRLDTLIELYHQATGLQIQRDFDKAEEKYRELLAKGGKDAQDAEIYWRTLLCHYGVEYQEDNGKTIPIILRPDLTDPSTMQVRKDLFAHIKEEQRAHYTQRLDKIDFYLERYRKLRMNKEWKYDVFISVKQNEDGYQTFDSDRASDLYYYFQKKPELAAKKLRVFNSRHTPLPKGDEYEPYIMTALMSAKLLIVVGSKSEYLDSRWVRSEWQRFEYLQAQDIKKTGKTERRLFCYFVGGMQPEKLPAGLNPDVQGVMGSVTAGDDILDVVEKMFPDVQKPVSQPTADETPEKIVGRMRAWLKLGEYQRVMEQYESLVDTSPEMLMTTPWICLYTLCAKNGFRKLKSLIAARGDVRHDKLYEFAYENADESLRAKLDALWAEKGAVPPIKEIPEAGQEAPRELVYADGRYVGQVVNQKRHGKGVMYYQNGEKYDGKWKDDKRAGHGVMFYQSGSKYDGEWENDQRNGQGVYICPDGDKYDGEWKNDQCTNKGVYSCKNGEQYENAAAAFQTKLVALLFKRLAHDSFQERKYPDGTYLGQVVDGKRHGKGVMYYKNRNKYTGDYVDDRKQGRGVYTWRNGETYDGEWKDGKRTGKGVYCYQNGEQYDGDFIDGIRNGSGVYAWPNGDKYDGEWKDDNRNGRGVLTWKNGGKYDGEWKDGLRSGHGVDYYIDGNRYEGEWRNDKWNGQGVYCFANGDRYEGEFLDGDYAGQGTLIKSSGKRIPYKDGRRRWFV